MSVPDAGPSGMPLRVHRGGGGSRVSVLLLFISLQERKKEGRRRRGGRRRVRPRGNRQAHRLESADQLEILFSRKKCWFWQHGQGWLGVENLLVCCRPAVVRPTVACLVSVVRLTSRWKTAAGRSALRCRGRGDRIVGSRQPVYLKCQLTCDRQPPAEVWRGGKKCFRRVLQVFGSPLLCRIGTQ